MPLNANASAFQGVSVVQGSRKLSGGPAIRVIDQGIPGP